MLLGLVVLVLAACGSTDEGDSDTSGAGGTEPEAFEFTGYVFRSEGVTRICDAILESYPPQCGGESYVVTGLDFSGMQGTETDQEVSWTNEPVTLQGVLTPDGKTLMVSPNRPGGGGPPPPTVGGQPGSAPG